MRGNFHFSGAEGWMADLFSNKYNYRLSMRENIVTSVPRLYMSVYAYNWREDKKADKQTLVMSAQKVGNILG